MAYSFSLDKEVEHIGSTQSMQFTALTPNIVINSISVYMGSNYTLNGELQEIKATLTIGGNSFEIRVKDEGYYSFDDICYELPLNSTTSLSIRFSGGSYQLYYDTMLDEERTPSNMGVKISSTYGWHCMVSIDRDSGTWVMNGYPEVAGITNIAMWEQMEKPFWCNWRFEVGRNEDYPFILADEVNEHWQAINVYLQREGIAKAAQIYYNNGGKWVRGKIYRAKRSD